MNSTTEDSPPAKPMVAVRRALLSVSDKTGLLDLARELDALGVELVSTGGTHQALATAGLPVRKVAEVTGFPEILDGRVKTLHPKIHGGILADRALPSHLHELEQHDIDAFDLVVVNLYPFRQTAARPGVSFAEVIENIDIGGPTMIRAAAKNFAHVLIVVEPSDYSELVTAIRAAGAGAVPTALRRRLAEKAFRHTQAYDAAISSWLAEQHGEAEAGLPIALPLQLARVLVPRYGENPHQAAAVYEIVGGPGVLGGFVQLQGKELSYNNLLDTDAARKLVALFDDPAVAIIKHNNPCGVGRGDELVTAYQRALACDPVSAFGSIIAVNRTVTGALARALSELFVEVVVAPGYEDEALARLRGKSQLRLLSCPLYRPAPDEAELRGIDGGFLAQHSDGQLEDPRSWTCPTARQPSPAERRALELAWKVARYVKSNAIVIANEEATLGIGAGQMSRVDSCELAIKKARATLAGSVAASDAFFPFRDGLDALAAAGVKAVAQPGGSKRDPEIIEAANEHGMAMLLTGQRHFRH